ncbi:MAG: hypothetical protein EA378_09375 [Phycisphaerales bacterium]|nr:MAG: hypothetical protein EA378_09375 [Phycisphaerales bacterium]
MARAKGDGAGDRFEHRPVEGVDGEDDADEPGADVGGAVSMPSRVTAGVAGSRPHHIPIRARPLEHETPAGGDEAPPRLRRFGAAEVYDGRVQAPVAYLYLSLAAVLAVLFLVWTAAYSMGRHDERSGYRDRLAADRDEGPLVSDPLNQVADRGSSGRTGSTPPPPVDRPVTGGRSGEARQPTTTPREEPRPPTRTEASPAPGGSPAPATGATAILTPGGGVASDPRESGLNYLVIASNVPQEEASRLPAFLDEFGIPAIAVPNLDRSGRPANNPPRYTVVVLQGVPGNQFSARAEERRRLEQRIAQLGRVWQRERGGSTDFRDPLWSRYNP